MADGVRVFRKVYEAMVAEARKTPMQECCGLLAGRDGVITHIFPAANLLASAREYEIGPIELFRIFKEMRTQKLDHLGIYHSHPGTPNEPSPRDLEGAYYPDAAYFILSPRAGAERPVRAFFIRDRESQEIEIEVV
jgi:proteasome lid subunit RPN8/RPN11